MKSQDVLFLVSTEKTEAEQISATTQTPRTVAHQAPLSMGILQAGILEWVACPPPGDFPHPGIEPRSLALQADS